VTWSVGIATGSCSEQSLEQVIEVFHAAGVRGIEIGTAPSHFDLRHPERVVAVSARLGAEGIAAASIHAPFGHELDLAHPDPGAREAGIAAIGAAARVIRCLGGSIVVAHPSDLIRSGADIGARLEASAASLQRAVDACRLQGVRLAIESPLPHLIGGHPDEFAWILEHVGDGAGVCLDTGHIALGRAWHRFLDVSAGRLIHIHASDNYGVYDDHLPPGDGTIGWASVMQSLSDAAFNGWMMLELRCPGSDAPAYFRRALDQTEALACRRPT
jgi:sugar phosphate isomerase/epimerase